MVPLGVRLIRSHGTFLLSEKLRNSNIQSLENFRKSDMKTASFSLSGTEPVPVQLLFREIPRSTASNLDFLPTDPVRHTFTPISG